MSALKYILRHRKGREEQAGIEKVSGIYQSLHLYRFATFINVSLFNVVNFPEGGNGFRFSGSVFPMISPV
jgi:hypothetical protein